MSELRFWLDPLVTLTAALIGGGISGYIALRIFRNETLERAKVRTLESEELYQERLTKALSEVIAEIALYAKSLQSPIVTEQLRGQFPLETAIDIAEIVARGEDRQMVAMLKSAFLQAHPKSSVESILTRLGIFSNTLSAWRSGRETFAVCYGVLEKTRFSPDSGSNNRN